MKLRLTLMQQVCGLASWWPGKAKHCWQWLFDASPVQHHKGKKGAHSQFESPDAA